MKKIIIDMPSALMEAANSSEAKDKPYNVCYSCPALADGCDGPNCLAMLYSRWVEWINALAKRKGLTRVAIAEAANLSLATVNSALSGKSQDIMLFTAAAITKAVKGGSWGKYPCHFVSLLMHSDFVETDDLEAVHNELEQTKAALSAAEARILDLEEQAKSARERREAAVAKAEIEAQKKVDYLKEQIAVKDRAAEESAATLRRRDRTVRTLGIIVGVLVAALLALFMIDAFVPTVGWFRY